MLKKIIITFICTTGLFENLVSMDNPAVKYTVIASGTCCCCNIIGTTLYALYVEKNHSYYEQRNSLDRAQRRLARQEIIEHNNLRHRNSLTPQPLRIER